MSQRVRDIMSRDVHVLPADCSIQEAAQKMQKFDVGAMPICKNDRLLGVVTDRDIVIRAVSEGKDFQSTNVEDILREGPLQYCFEDQDVEEVARMMESKQIRRLPVLNSERKLCGMVSIGDLATQTQDAELSGRTLQGVSEPDRPQIQH